MKVLGISGWSGSGKTVLITRVLPVLRTLGLRVATVKHAHHAFDIDIPGKDSFEHRAAGASEVIVASRRRIAQIQERRDETEPRLADLLRRLTPCDLVLVEGFKHEAHPKLEVFRSGNGREPIHPDDTSVVALVTDQAFPDARIPQVGIDDLQPICRLLQEHARPIAEVCAMLDHQGEA